VDKPKYWDAIKRILDTVSVECELEQFDAEFDAIRAEARAEALRDAADRAIAYLENAGPYYIAVSSRTIGRIRAAITQEPQP
jgi:uncharacterized protein YggE